MKFTFIGCSFTVGEGLELEKNDLQNYANIVAGYYNAEVTNLSESGNSNYRIFKTALELLLFDKTDVLFVQWSSLNRLWVYPGPNTELLLSLKIANDYAYRDIFYTKTQLQKLSNHWHYLNHDYGRLLELVDYCLILEQLAKNSATQLVFINGLLPWTSEISSIESVSDFDINLSSYTKELLDFTNRDNLELCELFMQLHNHVAKLNSDLWVNQFDSMAIQSVDVGTDNMHPGPDSHKLFASTVIKHLKTL